MTRVRLLSTLSDIPAADWDGLHDGANPFVSHAFLAGLEAQVRAWIEAEVDLTLAEICSRLSQQAGIQIKVPALWHQLDKWNLTVATQP